MIDVDFLPEWYMEKTRRERRVQQQYAILAGLFFVMVLWNSFSTRAISLASAELKLAEPQRVRAEHTTTEVVQLRQHLQELQAKMDAAQRLNVGIDVARTLMELGRCLDYGVIISRLSLQGHTFTDGCSLSSVSEETPENDTNGPNWVTPPSESSLVRVTVKARGRDMQAIAAFLSDLETSDYFQQVRLQYSRSDDVVATDAKVRDERDDRTVSDDAEYTATCEIQCSVPQVRYVGPPADWKGP